MDGDGDGMVGLTGLGCRSLAGLLVPGTAEIGSVVFSACVEGGTGCLKQAAVVLPCRSFPAKVV